MAHRWARGAGNAASRSRRMVSVAGLALLAPLMLSACVADGDRMAGTAASPDGGSEGTVTVGKPVLVTLGEAGMGGPPELLRKGSDAMPPQSRGTPSTVPRGATPSGSLMVIRSI